MKASLKMLYAIPAVVLALGFALPPQQKDDTYKVIKVNGAIVVKKTGRQLAQGDVFMENTPLQFKTTDAKATVINGEKGRFVLTGQDAQSKTNLIPAVNNIASRSGAIINILDLQNQFQGTVCVIEQLRIKIAGSDFKMSKDNFFYLEYPYNGEKISKKLAYSGDTLIIDKTELYKVDGKAITAPDSPGMSLYFRNSAENKSQAISSFDLVFPNENDLKSEVNIILTEFKNKPAAEKTDEVISYINEFYGKPVKSNVEGWLAQSFGIK